MSANKEQPLAYALTGMPAAGKTTAAKMLSAVDFQVYEIGDAVREVMEDYDYKISEIGQFLEKYKLDNGQEALARKTVEMYEEAQPRKGIPVIAGLRQAEEREYLENQFVNIETISIWADQSIRKERFNNRGRKDDKEGQSFEHRDIREWNEGVRDLIRESDQIITNEGSFEDLADSLIDAFDFNPNIYDITKIGDNPGQHVYTAHFKDSDHARQYSDSSNGNFEVWNPVISRETSSRDEIETDIQSFYTDMMLEAVK